MDFIHRHVWHNFGLKVISLVFAVALWVAVQRDPVAEIAIEVPIEFHNIPQNLEISSDDAFKTMLRLRGPERLIHQLGPEDVHAEVSLNIENPGERTFDLTDRQVRKPMGLEVVQIVPSQVHVVFDTRANRQIPVKPAIVGNLVSGVTIDRIQVDPPMISISGPKKHTDAAQSAITDPVDISGVTGQAKFVRHAYVSDPLIQVMNSDPVRITVMMKKAAASEGNR